MAVVLASQPVQRSDRQRQTDKFNAIKHLLLMPVRRAAISTTFSTLYGISARKETDKCV